VIATSAGAASAHVKQKASGIGKRLKAFGITTVIGGAHPTFLPDEALQYADFIMRGEGVLSLV